MSTAQRITLDLSGTDDATKSGGDFPVLPKGWYEVVIYTAEVREVKKQGPNLGKPFYNIRLNVTQEGDYYKRVVFDGFVGLWKEVSWKIEQIARALDLWDGKDRANFQVPTPDEIQGGAVEAYLKVERDTYAEEKAEQEAKAAGLEYDGEPIFRNAVTGYRPVGGWPDIDESGSPKKPAAKGARKVSL